MTVLQQRIVLASLGLITLLCLYVPWKWTWHGGSFIKTAPAGYGFLFAPPVQEWGAGWGLILDWDRLILELVVVSHHMAFGRARNPTAD